MRRRSWFLLLGLVAVLLLGVLPEEVWARVGGGHSFGGGGGSSGGSGGGGDGALLYLIFRLLLELCIHYPQVGIPLMLIFAGYGLYHYFNEGKQNLNTKRRFTPRSRGRRGPPWDQLRAHDPSFSRVVFVDFLNHLFTRVQLLKGEGDLDSVGPYLAEGAKNQLRKQREQNEGRKRTLEHVIIGATTIRQLQVTSTGEAQVNVEFEYNLSIRTEGREKAKPLFGRQTWRLKRAAGDRSPTPQGAKDLGCPNCGAPVNQAADGMCTYCDTAVSPGEISWSLTRAQVLVERPRHEYNLNLGGGDEEGTGLPDVIDPNLQQATQAFEARYPGFSWGAFQEHATTAFLALQKAWTDRSWEQARPFETDNLFHAHLFYLEQYRAQGLRNRLEQVQIRKLRRVRLESDVHYDAVTVRVAARGLEYTTDRKGRVVSGSKRKPRRFSEYWTFVRSAGFDKKKKSEWDAESCPNCGAPLDLNQAGTCGHCDTVVTSGEFSWVLASIQQDEAYRG